MHAILVALGLLGAKPPPIPGHILPRLVEIGVGTEAIKAAWEAVFWIGWGAGFVVGALLALLARMLIDIVVLTFTCLAIALSNRRLRHATDLAAHRALPGPGAWPDPRQAR